MERKRKVVTSQGVQFVVDGAVVKTMEERLSVSMGCRVEHSVCSICGVFDTKCTHTPSDENRAGDAFVSEDMFDFYLTAIKGYSDAQGTVIVEDVPFHMVSFVVDPDPGCELKYTEPNKNGDSFSVEKFKGAVEKFKGAFSKLK